MKSLRAWKQSARSAEADAYIEPEAEAELEEAARGLLQLNRWRIRGAGFSPPECIVFGSHSCHTCGFEWSPENHVSARDLIVIGTSAGGVEALTVIARGLPGDLAAAVLIVLHTSPEGPSALPEILSMVGSLEVAKTVDGATIEQGKIYVAPPDHHLLVRKNRIGLSRGPKENLARPAIDPLFRTAAAAYGPHVVGVILTGMLEDGTAGLFAVKERGGTTVVQDPEDALYSSMPTSALRHVGGDFVLPVSEIAPLLTRLVREPMKTRESLPVSRLIEIDSSLSKWRP